MIIAYHPRYPPLPIFIMPYHQEPESSRLLFAIFKMTETMRTNFYSAVIFDGMDFKAARHQFPGIDAWQP